MINTLASNIILWTVLIAFISIILYFVYKTVCGPYLKILYPFERKIFPNEIYVVLMINFIGMFMTPIFESIGINMLLLSASSRIFVVILATYYVLWVARKISINKSSYVSILMLTILFSFTNGINNFDFVSAFCNSFFENGTIFNIDTIMLLLQFVIMFIATLVFAGMILLVSLARFKGHRKVELKFEGEIIYGLLLGYDGEFYKIFNTKEKTTTLYKRSLTNKLTVFNECDVVDKYL